MVCKDLFMTRDDGTKLFRSYSDQGSMILQVETGILYSEAIDPEDMERAYEETDIPIETEEPIDEIEGDEYHEENIEEF